ncbi:ATP-binding protein, partial [Streptomyces durbertensis]|nr:ATP-binding protein [Streptomyces durbertensis]
ITGFHRGPAAVVEPAGPPAPATANGHRTTPLIPPPPPLDIASEGERPRLPRRRKQQHLVPELRTDPPARTHQEEEFSSHDPGLMAAFRRGASLADDTDDL